MMQLERQPVVQQCEGCNNIDEGLCKKWVSPAAKWRIGICPSASHVKVDAHENGQKVRVGQQKQKKKK